MKRILILCTVSLFSASCDQEKVEKAKQDTIEAGKSVGDLAKDTATKGLEKSKEALKVAGEKIKTVKDTVVAKANPALDNFKARLTGFSETMKGMQGKAGDDPAKAQELMTVLMTKLSAIPSDGIPEDLGTAFRNYQGIMRRIMEVTRDIPADPAAQQKWQMEHADEMHKLETDSQKALKALKEAAAKHGLTGLDLGGSTE